MLPERSSAHKNSKSKNGKSGGSRARHDASSTCPMPESRSTRIASAPIRPVPRSHRASGRSRGHLLCDFSGEEYSTSSRPRLSLGEEADDLAVGRLGLLVVDEVPCVRCGFEGVVREVVTEPVGPLDLDQGILLAPQKTRR